MLSRLLVGRPMDLFHSLQGALSDRYHLERTPKHGGMAFVYGARDLRHGRRVAVKVLKPDLAETVGAERFLREIQIEARLQHAHILPLFDSGIAGGLLYYVMPFVAGESLRERLQREVQLAIDDALEIAGQVADALDYAHSHGVVHRDIKPENILLADGHAYVSDFGVARAAGAAGGDWQNESGTSVWRTESGLAIGTLGYMSPEQATGARTLDGRSDQYSLACVVYEMLTGETPFPGHSLGAVVAKMLSLPAPSVRVVRETASSILDQALRRALAKAPADRFKNCGEFMAALQRPPSALDRLTDLAATRIAKVGLSIVVVTALAVTLSVIARDARRPGVAPDTTRYVIFPSRSDGRSIPDLNEAVRLRDALSRWDGVTVVDPGRVREIGEAATVSVASDVATRLGAGRFVRLSVAPLGDSLRVQATLYEVQARGPPRELTGLSTRLPRDLAGAEAAFASLADRLLFRGLSPETAPAPSETRSLPASQAFLNGQRALETWELATAESAFFTATGYDPAYARAQLWLALVRSWSDASPARWRLAAEQATLRRDRLSRTERDMLDAVRAQARGELAAACPLWQRLTETSPQAYTAWYGYATCLRADDVVLRDAASSPSGWRFRTSYQEELRAYRRAFELHPAILSGFRGSAYQRTPVLLATDSRRVVPGQAAAPDTQTFRARVVWTGDSLILLPYPFAVAQRPAAPWEQHQVLAAVQRQREMFHEIAVNWVTAFPHSAAAMEALAVALEMLDSPAAVDTLRRARALATSEAERIGSATAEVWMQVKLGAPWGLPRLRQAKALADSLLREPSTGAPAAGALASVAALTGRAALAALLARRAALESGWVPPPLAAAPALLLFASLGGPADSLRLLEREVAERIGGFPAPERERLALEWLGRSARLAALVSAFPSVQRLRGQGDYLVDALAAWADGDTQAVRGTLDRLRQTRQSVWPPDRAIDALYPEAVLFTWLNDDRGAIAWLDPTLTSLLKAAPGTFTDPARPGTLVNAMALRADLAARTGDRDGARRWAEAVLVLWSDADDFLQPLVERMRRLVNQ